MSKNQPGRVKPPVNTVRPIWISLPFALVAMAAHYWVSGGMSQFDAHALGAYLITGVITFGIAYAVSFSGINREVMEAHEAKKIADWEANRGNK